MKWFVVVHRQWFSIQCILHDITQLLSNVCWGINHLLVARVLYLQPIGINTLDPFATTASFLKWRHNLHLFITNIAQTFSCSWEEFYWMAIFSIMLFWNETVDVHGSWVFVMIGWRYDTLDKWRWSLTGCWTWWCPSLTLELKEFKKKKCIPGKLLRNSAVTMLSIGLIFILNNKMLFQKEITNLVVYQYHKMWWKFIFSLKELFFSYIHLKSWKLSSSRWNNSWNGQRKQRSSRKYILIKELILMVE